MKLKKQKKKFSQLLRIMSLAHITRTVICISLCQILWKEGAYSTEAKPPKPCLPDNKWNNEARLRLKAGRLRNLGQIGLFAPLAQNDTSLLFTDLRFFRDSKNNSEGNFGLAYRNLNPSLEWIFGGYGFFDSRRSEHHHMYQQATLGLEALSVHWDYRANVYIPLSKAKKIHSRHTKPVYRGHTEYFNSQKEVPLKGFDGEVGRSIPGIDNVRLYVGGYHFQGSGARHINGVRTRIEWDISDNFDIEAEYQYDNVRHSAPYIGFTLRIPFGEKTSKKLTPLEKRMQQDIIRDIDIVTQAKPTQRETGNYFIFTKEGGTGDGTFENPAPKNAVVVHNLLKSNPNYKFYDLDSGAIVSNSAKVQELLEVLPTATPSVVESKKFVPEPVTPAPEPVAPVAEPQLAPPPSENKAEPENTEPQVTLTETPGPQPVAISIVETPSPVSAVQVISAPTQNLAEVSSAPAPTTTVLTEVTAPQPATATVVEIPAPDSVLQEVKLVSAPTPNPAVITETLTLNSAVVKETASVTHIEQIENKIQTATFVETVPVSSAIKIETSSTLESTEPFVLKSLQTHLDPTVTPVSSERPFNESPSAKPASDPILFTEPKDQSQKLAHSRIELVELTNETHTAHTPPHIEPSIIIEESTFKEPVKVDLPIPMKEDQRLGEEIIAQQRLLEEAVQQETAARLQAERVIEVEKIDGQRIAAQQAEVKRLETLHVETQHQLEGKQRLEEVKRQDVARLQKAKEEATRLQVLEEARIKAEQLEIQLKAEEVERLQALEDARHILEQKQRETEVARIQKAKEEAEEAARLKAIEDARIEAERVAKAKADEEARLK
ncbi:MAG: inverse autotransporter beta domain-containing protein, partial [Proteobacteria bacterium]|nr:inverse autotransporter beta domain-containing protein [Pseudomonadota bacterium]